MQETLVDELCLLVLPLLRSHVTEHQLKVLLTFITKMNQIGRKQLIAVCRSCSVPVAQTTLYDKTRSFILQLEATFEPVLLQQIYEILTSPLTAGLFITLAISLPMDEKAIRETYSALLSKEMLVMESSPLPNSISYECFFGEYSRPFHPTIDPNPVQAARIHAIINSWIDELESLPVILPHMTLKLVSKHTQQIVNERYPDYQTFEEEGATQPDLETIYMRYGDQLSDGSCEVKQRWYTSGLTPRTYYAAGSKAYHNSKYMRDSFNRLCDLLPPTERFSRVNTRRVVLSSPLSHAIIYDLTSFTSNMHEQRHFLDRLALYCRGRRVRILDAIEGTVEQDLGDLICQYNELNTYPTYSSEKLIGKGVQLVHHVAGFLGVYGNLATCTFLHGAVMSCLVDSFSQLGVAGDDGIIDSYDDWITFFALRLLGLAEESKGYSTIDPGYQIYLKRPIRQVGNRLYSESFALYAMVEHLFDEDDRRFFPHPRSRLERKRSLASACTAYLRSLSSLPELSEHKSEVREFLASVYKKAGFPESGHIPYLPSDFGSHQVKLPDTFIPSLDSIFHDPVEYTIKSLYSGSVSLPIRVPEIVPFESYLLFAGSTFECTGSKWLSYYRKMGFVEIEQENEVLVGEEGLNGLLDIYTRSRLNPVYVVTVVHDVPLQLIG